MATAGQKEFSLSRTMHAATRHRSQPYWGALHTWFMAGCHGLHWWEKKHWRLLSAEITSCTVSVFLPPLMLAWVSEALTSPKVCWGQAHNVQSCHGHALNITLCSSQVIKVHTQTARSAGEKKQPCIYRHFFTKQYPLMYEEATGTIAALVLTLMTLVWWLAIHVAVPAAVPWGLNQPVANDASRHRLTFHLR